MTSPLKFNSNLDGTEPDFLYHLALNTNDHDLKLMFSDIKFVVVSGSSRRIEKVAHTLLKELRITLPVGTTLVNIAQATDRYVMFKVGPVLCLSHGMGVPSISIMLHELIKLLSYAGALDVELFRLGTSGGIGVVPGTVVVTRDALDARQKAEYEVVVLGAPLVRPTYLDPELRRQLIACQSPQDPFKILEGNTLCAMDFYEGQGRLDGAFCNYTAVDKMKYLHGLHAAGVLNIEMESLCFAALCHAAGYKAAVVCATLLDRLEGDQVKETKQTLSQFENHALVIILRYIKRKMGLAPTMST